MLFPKIFGKILNDMMKKAGSKYEKLRRLIKTNTK